MDEYENMMSVDEALVDEYMMGEYRFDGYRLLSKLYKAEYGGDIQEVVETLSLQDKMEAFPIAATHGLYKVMVYLLEHLVVDVHYVDSGQNNLMHKLLNSFKVYEPDRRDLILQCVVKLVDAGVDVNQVNDNKDTPILIASREGLFEVVIYLLEHGVDLPQQTQNVLVTFVIGSNMVAFRMFV